MLYSPLEQFEFITIFLVPELGKTKLNAFLYFDAFDHSNIIQSIFSTRNLRNAASIIIDCNFNLSILETLEFIKNGINNIVLNPDILDIDLEDDSYDFGHTIENIDSISLEALFGRSEYSKITFFWLNIYNSIAVVLIVFVLCFIFFNIIGKNIYFYNLWTYLVDLFFSFLLQTFLSLADRRLLNYFAIFCSFFLLIFISNLTALVPLSFCLTSNLWLTLTLSLSVWVSVTVLAILVRGLGFFSGFVPSNVPAALKGFITVIEVISYLARAISLGVRIFANMLAGHSLVHILSDLVETCIISFNHTSLKMFGIFPAIILTFILFIEFGICFLQALVFVILTAIYLKEAFGFSAH